MNRFSGQQWGKEMAGRKRKGELEEGEGEGGKSSAHYFFTYIFN